MTVFLFFTFFNTSSSSYIGAGGRNYNIVLKHPVALIYHNIYIHRPINNTTVLAAWKNLQPNITKLIITLHQHQYDLHNTKGMLCK
jgi:hypothetical protein